MRELRSDARQVRAPQPHDGAQVHHGRGHFGEAEAIELGAEKSHALVRYGQALARQESPTLLLSRDAKLAGVLLRDSTAAAILKAARELVERRRAGAAADDDTAQEVDRAVRRLGAKLRRAGAPGAKLKRVRRGGAWRVTIELDADGPRAPPAF
ncbi:MAG: hypothetical protein IPN34_27725 [Planctomycetes bacterium]|nr:hypothetical protein [Planctomycetota bacterium]